MCHEDHEPCEHRTKHRDRQHEQKRSVMVASIQNSREADARGGDKQRGDGNTIAREYTEAARREARTGERKEHPGGDIKLAVHGRERGDEDDEIDDSCGTRNLGTHHDGDKGR